MAYPNDYSSGDQLPADDINKIKNSIISSLNAGETINGATLPVAVYVKNDDGEIYKTDANDTSGKLEFIGFAITNSTDGDPITVQTKGIIDGFSGLTIGARYYLSDTPGEISESEGTISVMIGIAISATKLIIIGQEEKMVWGSDSFSASDGSPDANIQTIGFKVKKVFSFCTLNFVDYYDSGYSSTSHGMYAKGASHCLFIGKDESANPAHGRSENLGAYSGSSGGGGGSVSGTIAISSITDTGFTLTFTGNCSNADKTHTATITYLCIG